MRPLFFRLIRLSLLMTAMLLTACSTGEEADTAWGEEAVTYFDELASAYSANDYYGVLDFYVSDAFQDKRRASISSGLLIRDLLIWNSGDLGHDVLSTHLGEDGALILIRWEVSGGLSVVLSSIDDGRIAAETVFDHAVWVERSLRADPETVAQYEALYESFGSDEGLDPIALSQTVNSAPIEGPAVFLGPSAFGEDPQRAVGVYVIENKGCESQVAVLWTVDDKGGLEEERYLRAASVGRCDPPNVIEGWWDGLELPEPRDQIVTSLLTTASGQQVEVANGTPAIESLLTEGLQQFTLAGLEVPDFDRVTFEPTRKCENRSGRLIQDEDSRQLFICFFASDLCATALACDDRQLRVRALVLHELAHAWLIDHVDADTRNRMLDDAGLDVWDAESVSWNRRGVEYAAEVIAWGLLDDAIPMVRIGSPPCEELARSFWTLTGVVPLGEHKSCG